MGRISVWVVSVSLLLLQVPRGTPHMVDPKLKTTLSHLSNGYN